MACFELYPRRGTSEADLKIAELGRTTARRITRHLEASDPDWAPQP
jgi:hypothetical protein